METLTFQERLIRVQQELKAPKGQFNSFGKYAYRNCEDILESVKPLLAKYGLCLTITDEVMEVAGVIFCNARAIVFDHDGTTAEVTAQAGIDVDKKGMDLSQTFGSASSYARKYALNGLFLIDDTKDADATNKHDKTGSAPRARQVSKPVLGNSGEVFDRVKAYLATEGGDLAKVKEKYTVSKEVEKLLIN
jgi:hypothetical protein